MMFDKCARYRKFKLLAEDGRATRSQIKFLEHHQEHCSTCLEEHERTMRALSFLKSNVVEPLGGEDMEIRIIRRWRTERRNRVVTYWMPAVAGAVVAGAALLAVLQILVASPEIKQQNTKGREALLLRNSGETSTPLATETPNNELK